MSAINPPIMKIDRDKTIEASKTAISNTASHLRRMDLSLMTGLVYFLVVMMILVRQVEEEKTVEPFLLIFFGLELQMLVYHTYCLLTHSAMPLSEKPVTAIVCYSVSGLIQLVSIFNRLDDFPIAMVGYGSSGWIHLTTGVFFLYLALMHLIALLHKEKE